MKKHIFQSISDFSFFHNKNYAKCGRLIEWYMFVDKNSLDFYKKYNKKGLTLVCKKCLEKEVK